MTRRKTNWNGTSCAGTAF